MEAENNIVTKGSIHNGGKDSTPIEYCTSSRTSTVPIKQKDILRYPFFGILVACPWLAAYILILIDLMTHRRSYWPIATGSALWLPYELRTARIRFEENNSIAAAKRFTYVLYVFLHLCITTCSIVFGSGCEKDELGILPTQFLVDRLMALSIYFIFWTVFYRSKIGQEKGIIFSLWGLTQLGMLRLSFQPDTLLRVFIILLFGTSNSLYAWKAQEQIKNGLVQTYCSETTYLICLIPGTTVVLAMFPDLGRMSLIASVGLILVLYPLYHFGWILLTRWAFTKDAAETIRSCPVGCSGERGWIDILCPKYQNGKDVVYNDTVSSALTSLEYGVCTALSVNTNAFDTLTISAANFSFLYLGIVLDHFRSSVAPKLYAEDSTAIKQGCLRYYRVFPYCAYLWFIVMVVLYTICLSWLSSLWTTLINIPILAVSAIIYPRVKRMFPGAKECFVALSGSYFTSLYSQRIVLATNLPQCWEAILTVACFLRLFAVDVIQNICEEQADKNGLVITVPVALGRVTARNLAACAYNCSTLLFALAKLIVHRQHFTGLAVAFLGSTTAVLATWSPSTWAKYWPLSNMLLILIGVLANLNFQNQVVSTNTCQQEENCLWL